MYAPLFPLLRKLYPFNSATAIEEILGVYGKQWYAIVDFLYFANIVFNRLAYTTKNKEQSHYQKALETSDILLPDGIALELLTQKYLRTKIHNLNGTDFLPFFLHDVTTRYNIRVFLYGGTEEVVQKAWDHIEKTFSTGAISVQNGFREYDWSEIGAITTENPEAINIFLVGRGTPRQEIWMEENRESLQQYGCIAFAVGGLLDFWSGTEQRAPDWIRVIRGEWLYRVIRDPKKNLRKTLASLMLFWYLAR